MNNIENKYIFINLDPDFIINLIKHKKKKELMRNKK